jgi:hypothetical protein
VEISYCDKLSCLLTGCLFIHLCYVSSVIPYIMTWQLIRKEPPPIGFERLDIIIVSLLGF